MLGFDKTVSVSKSIRLIEYPFFKIVLIKKKELIPDPIMVIDLLLILFKNLIQNLFLLKKELLIL